MTKFRTHGSFRGAVRNYLYANELQTAMLYNQEIRDSSFGAAAVLNPTREIFPSMAGGEFSFDGDP